MEQVSKDFLNKVRVNTYIYTFTFIALAVGYGLKYSEGAEPMILLIAAFAFCTLGRQIRLATDMGGALKADTQPKGASLGPWAWLLLWLYWAAIQYDVYLGLLLFDIYRKGPPERWSFFISDVDEIVGDYHILF